MPMIQVPAGLYESFVPERKAKGADLKAPVIVIHPFEIDQTVVTNRQFLSFVLTHNNWQKNQASGLFTDASYLAHWQNSLQLGPLAPPESPVVNVSWFAARFYCKEQGKRLPSTYEWEYLADSQFYGTSREDRDIFLQTIMEWYARPSVKTLGPVGQASLHRLGVKDLHGLVWEWTSDFNSVIAAEESRENSSLDADMFCGAGSLGGKDPSNYANFMRFAFRSSLKGGFSLANLGFRCARDIAP